MILMVILKEGQGDDMGIMNKSPWCEQSWVDHMEPSKQTLFPRFLQWSERASLRLCCRAHSGDQEEEDIEALLYWDLFNSKGVI